MLSRVFELLRCILAYMLQASESECDGMRNRLRAIHESAEQKETTLKKYEACMARQ